MDTLIIRTKDGQHLSSAKLKKIHVFWFAYEKDTFTSLHVYSLKTLRRVKVTSIYIQDNSTLQQSDLTGKVCVMDRHKIIIRPKFMAVTYTM